MTSDETRCHCGRAIHTHDDGLTRGLCVECDAVRCDAYPGACAPDETRPDDRPGQPDENEGDDAGLVGRRRAKSPSSPDWESPCPNCITPWKCNGPHVLTPAEPRPALIAAQREKGWVDFGPEDFCHRCGGRNVYSWHTPNDVWNATVGDRWDGIVCPQCFTDLARSAGVEPSVWTLADGDALAAEIERLRKRRDNAHREMLRARAEVKRKEEHLARTQQERNEARDVIAAVTAERDRARRALAELLDAVSPAIFKPGAEATFRAALTGDQPCGAA